MAKESAEFPESSPVETSKPRRKSTGTIDTKTGKLVVKSRYRGNHVPSTHDFCKLGHFSQIHEKAEVKAGNTRRKSIGTFSRQIPPITKQETSIAVKRNPLAASNSSSDSSVNSGPSNSRKHTEIARSGNGLRIKTDETVRKKQETASPVTGKSSLAKDCNKGKEKIEKIDVENAKESILIVVESSKNQNVEDDQALNKKETAKNRHQSLSSPLLESKISSKSSDLVSPKIESSKEAKRINPKKTGIKMIPEAKNLSFKKGKVLETKKSDNSTSKWTKFRKSIGLEPKIDTKEKMKSLKSVEIDVKKTDSCESKQENVVLKHNNIEEKKKHPLFNHVIEETLSKFSFKKKSKVKILVAVFENANSLHENKTTTTTTSASKVRPLDSNE